jgi:hypothetical protein
MKLNLFLLQQEVLNLDGTKALRAKPGSTTGEVDTFTVKDAFRMALNGTFIDEQPTQAKPEGSVTLEQKMKRYDLSKKLWHCNDEDGIDLSVEELSELKKCVGKAFISPEIYGFLSTVIEGKDPVR